MIRGKSFKAVTEDIAEGYVTVNPIFLKALDADTLKELLSEIARKQADIRAEKFPSGDISAIRRRNLRLQKLHSAAMVVRNFARERRLRLY
ncbi:MAG: hypothetical protein Kow0025_16420 [Thermodesulfovibrionales bacterium]